MVVHIVGKLEDVRRQVLLVRGCVAILCGVLGQDGVSVGGHILVGVEDCLLLDDIMWTRRRQKCITDDENAEEGKEKEEEKE